MSGSAEEGPLLGSVKPSQMPPGRGTLVTRKAGPQLTQIAWLDPTQVPDGLMDA
jgi:S-DNA-T family DNA segregation ATPase FtsK/SpoIIIE